jgi:hypothetical protein
MCRLAPSYLVLRLAPAERLHLLGELRGAAHRTGIERVERARLEQAHRARHRSRPDHRRREVALRAELPTQFS